MLKRNMIMNQLFPLIFFDITHIVIKRKQLLVTYIKIFLSYDVIFF